MSVESVGEMHTADFLYDAGEHCDDVTQVDFRQDMGGLCQVIMAIYRCEDVVYIDETLNS